jgi:hypothetical protein
MGRTGAGRVALVTGAGRGIGAAADVSGAASVAAMTAQVTDRLGGTARRR